MIIHLTILIVYHMDNLEKYNSLKDGGMVIVYHMDNLEMKKQQMIYCKKIVYHMDNLENYITKKPKC